LEVELTRRGVEHLVGRTVAAIEVSDPLVVQDGVDAMLAGSTITGFDRRGKQLVVLTNGPTIGVHLGMTGRIIVDISAPSASSPTAAEQTAPDGIVGCCAFTTARWSACTTLAGSAGWCSIPTSRGSVQMSCR